MTHDSILLESVNLGALRLSNRMVMAPMTRGRAEPDHTPNALMVEYYRQRATAGLIVTEATAISRQGFGWVGAPGIYTDAHVAGWRRVTDAVHAAGGLIVAQLWHMGRVSHPDFLDGELPVAPSAIAAKGDTHTPKGKRDYVTPRSLTTAEIAATVMDFAKATTRAREAGFDGVEIHGANGYLVDQFIRDGSNRRTDEYGGSTVNRLRFLLEVTQAVSGAWSPDRVGVRLSPTGVYNDMHDSAPEVTFSLAAQKLSTFGLAYLHVIEALPGSFMHVEAAPVAHLLRQAFGGPLLLNGGYDAEHARAALREKRAEAITFGLPFLANPDLVRRAGEGAALNAPDFATLYTPGPKGYTDYPALG